MRKQIINISQVPNSNYIKKFFMLINFQFLIIFSLILILTPFLTSCGGGGGTGGSSNPKITRMVVFGDSLPDYGVFGHKKNIQASVATGPGSSPMFADLIATNKNLPDACNYYVGSPDNVFNAVFSIFLSVVFLPELTSIATKASVVLITIDPPEFNFTVKLKRSLI